MISGIPHSVIQRVVSGSISAESIAIEFIGKDAEAVSYAALMDLFLHQDFEGRVNLIIMDGSLESLLGYLWSVRFGLSTIVVAGGGTASRYEIICSTFCAHLVISSRATLTNLFGLTPKVRDNQWFSVIETEFDAEEEITPGTTLLATSGSTGDPKFVALSNSGILSNAEDISSMLRMSEQEVSAGVLPLSYSYGLSVLHSTLLMGGKYLHGPGVQPLSRGFLNLLSDKKVTHLPGVPFTHDLYEKIGLYSSPPLHLRCVTQAGGRLDPAKVRQFYESLWSEGIRFHPMYGQTEASARIAIMPHDKVQEFPAYVGLAVQSGSLSISPESGQIIFEGPNVMLGYVDSLTSMRFSPAGARRLETGDTGEIGPHGLLRVLGRIKRIAKINGSRVDLDTFSAPLDPAKFAVVESAGKLVVAVTSNNLRDQALVRAQEFGLQKRDLIFVEVAEIPRLENGKPDFKSIEKVLG